MIYAGVLGLFVILVTVIVVVVVCCYKGYLGGLDWLLALTALGMDWTDDDNTMRTTVNDIYNITFIKL